MSYPVMPGNRSDSIVCACGSPRVPGTDGCTFGHGFPQAIRVEIKSDGEPRAAQVQETVSPADVASAVFEGIFGEKTGDMMNESGIHDTVISKGDIVITGTEIRDAVSGYMGLIRDNEKDPRTTAAATLVSKFRRIFDR
jgi:hypothetical protein